MYVCVNTNYSGMVLLKLDAQELFWSALDAPHCKPKDQLSCSGLSLICSKAGSDLCR